MDSENKVKEELLDIQEKENNESKENNENQDNKETNGEEKKFSTIQEIITSK